MDFATRGLALETGERETVRTEVKDVPGFALLVGVGNSSMGHLPAAGPDTADVYRALRDRYGFAPEHMRLLVDSTAGCGDLPVAGAPDRASFSKCLEELGKDPKRFSPRGIHAQISKAKNELVSPEEYAARVASFWDQTVAEAYELYQRRLHASNAADFDDLLMLTVQVFERFPEALARWQRSFRYVLVDEYQDTNHAQYRLLQLLAGEHGNICAVGDPDQSIYAFRGADIRNILDFEHDFGGADTIALEQNYRSTNAILEAANAVIDNNRDRKPKRLWSELGEGEPVEVVEVEDEHAEARFVAAEIARLVESGYSAAEIAAQCPMGEAEALRAACGLYLAGILEAGSPQAPSLA